MAKQGEVKEITKKEALEFKGEGEEVKKEMIPPLTPQEGNNPPLAPQETTPPLTPQEGKKRTSVITIQGGKPVRIYYEDGKQVKVEAI